MTWIMAGTIYIAMIILTGLYLTIRVLYLWKYETRDVELIDLILICILAIVWWITIFLILGKFIVTKVPTIKFSTVILKGKTNGPM